MRVVLDANVIISAMLSRDGSPAQVLRAWQEGRFELIVSPLLLAELERALAYPKLRNRIPAHEAEALVAWLARAVTVASDPETPPPMHAPDPADDYLLSLAAAEDALLVSGDNHLLTLREGSPIYSPGDFLALLDRTGP